MSSEDNVFGRTGKHPLKIIGAGYSRAGTVSLKLALQELGFGYCYHPLDVLNDKKLRKDILWWNNIDHRLKNDPKSINFDEFFGSLNNCSAAIDWPIYFYWKELAAFYPNAKIIVSVRDPEKWYKSCCSILSMYNNNYIYQFISKLFDYSRMISSEWIPNSVKEFGGMNAFFNEKENTINHMINRPKNMLKMDEYNIKNRTLIFNVKEGWEPLCKFLGCNVPKNIPFPHANERDFMKNSIKKHFIYLIKYASFYIGIFVVLLSIIIIKI